MIRPHPRPTSPHKQCLVSGLVTVLLIIGAASQARASEGPAYGIAPICSAGTSPYRLAPICSAPGNLESNPQPKTGTNITADHITRDANGVLVATGHVIIQRKDQTMYADVVHYDVPHHWIKAEGHVTLLSPQGEIDAKRANLHTDTQAGTMDDATLTMPDGSHMVAKRIHRIDPNTYEAETLRYSACPADKEAWNIAASHGRLDEKKGVLVTHNTRFDMEGVPLLYTPYWINPLRRRSGFLLAMPAVSSQRGTEWELPLYIAPSPNWDATLTPHWMSKHGLMKQLELRHASKLGKEQFNGETIHDRITNTTRSRISGKVDWTLPHEMFFNATGDYVSDRQYLADFSQPGQAVSSYTVSQADLTGINRYSSWSLLGQYEQNLGAANDKSTIQLLPRLSSNTAVPVNRNLIVHFDQQTTDFYRQIGVHGWRMDLNPYIEVPWMLHGGGLDVTAKVGSHLTRYWLQQRSNPSGALQRATGEASLEIRPVFERISDDRNWKHTISPVLRYDYIHAPADQSNLPNFDSGFSQLTMGNLLMGNRFSGYDRIQRVNRVSLLLQTALYTHEGEDRHVQQVVSAAVGASYDMLLTTVDPSIQALPTRHLSNMLANISITPIPYISLYSSGQFNTQYKYWETVNSGTGLSDPRGDNLSVDYIFTDHRYANAVRQYTGRTSIIISQRWSLNGYAIYDAIQHLIQQETVGVLYQHPCWSLEIDTFRYNRPTGTTSNKDYGFRFLLQFKGMGSVGGHG